MTIKVTAPAGSLTLSQMPIEALRAEFAAAIKITAAHLSHLATVWREMERRGEDLSDLRSGLWTYMPLIASGDLRPELVVKYAGRLLLLRKVAALSMADQDRLLRDDNLPVLVQVDDEWVERTVPLTQISTPMLGIVLRDRIIPPKEQRHALVGATVSRTVSAGRQPEDRAIAAARKRRAYVSGRVAQNITMTVTEAELDALREWAESAQLPLATLIAGALASVGFMKPPK